MSRRTVIFAVAPSARQDFVKRVFADTRPATRPCIRCGNRFLQDQLTNSVCDGCRASRAARSPSAALLAESHAAAEGRRLGQLHRGDPYRLARELGAQVQRVPAAQIQNRNRPLTFIRGRTSLLTNIVSLADSLTPREEGETLAHEVGHLLRLDAGLEGIDAERTVDAFAAAFLSSAPEHPLLAQAKAAQRFEALVRSKARR